MTLGPHHLHFLDAVQQWATTTLSAPEAAAAIAYAHWRLADGAWYPFDDTQHQFTAAQWQALTEAVDVIAHDLLGPARES